MIVFADVEGDGLNPTKLHCICVDSDLYGPLTFTNMDSFATWVKSTPSKITWVFHNGLGYDVDAINKLTDVTINPKDVVDTFVVSRMADYNKFKSHSLKELGEYLKVYKGDYDGGWDTCTPEMIEYCEQDVQVLKAVFNHFKDFIFSPSNRDALRLEHDFAVVCKGMETVGFPFNKSKAEGMLSSITDEMSSLEEEFQNLLGDRRVEKKRVKLRYRKDGELFAFCVRAMSEPDYEIDGDEIVVYERQEFNPASPKQRIDALWKYGWKPVDKTVGHIKHLRSKRYE